VLAGIFRQLVPLFISTRDPEGTLLFLLPVIRPFLPLMAFAADPFHKLFDRSRTKEQELAIDDQDEDEDATDDIQALIDDTAGAATGLDALSKLVLAAAREMTADGAMAETTFAALQAELGNERVVDLTLTIGFYNAVVRVLATLQIDVVPGRDVKR